MPASITAFPQAKIRMKGGQTMKKYMAPEMEILAFADENGIASVMVSDMFNNGEFGSW